MTFKTESISKVIQWYGNHNYLAIWIHIGFHFVSWYRLETGIAIPKSVAQIPVPVPISRAL
jgi:hypothetical protein